MDCYYDAADGAAALRLALSLVRKPKPKQQVERKIKDDALLKGAPIDPGRSIPLFSKCLWQHLNTNESAIEASIAALREAAVLEKWGIHDSLQVCGAKANTLLPKFWYHPTFIEELNKDDFFYPDAQPHTVAAFLHDLPKCNVTSFTAAELFSYRDEINKQIIKSKLVIPLPHFDRIASLSVDPQQLAKFDDVLALADSFFSDEKSEIQYYKSLSTILHSIHNSTLNINIFESFAFQHNDPLKIFPLLFAFCTYRALFMQLCECILSVSHEHQLLTDILPQAQSFLYSPAFTYLFAEAPSNNTLFEQLIHAGDFLLSSQIMNGDPYYNQEFAHRRRERKLLSYLSTFSNHHTHHLLRNSNDHYERQALTALNKVHDYAAASHNCFSTTSTSSSSRISAEVSSSSVPETEKVKAVTTTKFLVLPPPEALVPFSSST
uniref:Uncharacterized protein n=1 Tax=Aureoumbra lagunensis TaxID=44058 RepID=A0A7S3K2L5_9STRA